MPRGAGGSLWKRMKRIISLASVQCMESTTMDGFNRLCFFAVNVLTHAVDTTISQLRKMRKMLPGVETKKETKDAATSTTPAFPLASLTFYIGIPVVPHILYRDPRCTAHFI